MPNDITDAAATEAATANRTAADAWDALPFLQKVLFEGVISNSPATGTPYGKLTARWNHPKDRSFAEILKGYGVQQHNMDDP